MNNNFVTLVKLVLVNTKPPNKLSCNKPIKNHNENFKSLKKNEIEKDTRNGKRSPVLMDWIIMQMTILPK